MKPNGDRGYHTDTTDLGFACPIIMPSRIRPVARTLHATRRLAAAMARRMLFVTRTLYCNIRRIRHTPQDNELAYQCNICGRNSYAPIAHLTREEKTCLCGSSVRLRALIHVLSLELFGSSLTLPNFPLRRDLVGIDMSGAATYAQRLSKRLGYTNTFLHKSPRLDITEPNSSWIENCDFVISSDVFEHVAPPIERAFTNTFQILKPGGVFVLTVPYTPVGDTVEHFPDLYEYRIERSNGKWVLLNTTREGILQEFDNLVFHGGDGETLELRIFSKRGVLSELQRAGFVDINIHKETVSDFGILWPQEWSLPISARRP